MRFPDFFLPMASAWGWGWGLGGVLLLAGCGGGHPTRDGPDSEVLPEVAAQVLVAEAVSMASTQEVVATVGAERVARIAARISGPIEEMAVVLGQPVEQGELLLRIDETEIRARLAQARAQLLQAESDFRREQQLRDQGAATQEQFEQAATRLEVARQTVEEVETVLGYATIRAPFSGVVTQRPANSGDLATPGAVLLVLEDPRVLRAEAEVPETLVFDLKMGMELPVEVTSPGLVLTGRITEIAPAANPVSRTFLVKLALPEHPRLRSGQFARVAVPGKEIEALLVPLEAVRTLGAVEQIFVEREGRARLRLVKTGRRYGAKIEVLSGLEAEERVLLSAGSPLRDGQPVRLID